MPEQARQDPEAGGDLGVGEVAADPAQLGALAMAQRLARTVADGRTISIDGAAHYPNMERPDLFNDILDGFASAAAS
ncbi:alpha/beta fold hydrolase [Nonomuraea sp. NPDC003201]